MKSLLNNFSIKKEMLFWFFMISVMPIVMLFGVNYFLQKNQFKAQAKEHLELILNEKVSKLETQIADFEKNIKLIASLPKVTEGFLKTKEDFERNRTITTDNSELVNLFNKAINKNDFYDIFFIDMEGNVIYTLKRESDLGTNLLNGIYKDTNLASLYKKTRMFLDSKISNFAYYPPSHGHAAFIAHPIYYEEKIVGVLAIQFAKNRLFEIFGDKRGLGESGELFASRRNEHNKIVSTTPLKYNQKSVENEFEFDKEKKLASNLAANGSHGVGELKDYRGVEVIAAWDYIPSLNWGIVAKIDLDEILIPIHKIEFISIIIIFFVLLGITIAIIIVTKFIVDPLEILTNSVKNFSLHSSKESFSIEKISHLHNEIGLLAKNFQEMGQNLLYSQKIIKKNSDDLEIKVQQRTKELENTKDELSNANDSMKRHLELIDTYVITSSTDLIGIITEVSSAFCRISGYTREELIGKKHSIIRHPSTPNELYNDMWKKLSNGKTWRGEIRNLAKDGTFYWVYSTISPKHDANNKKVGYTSIRQDITSQKVVEELSITDQLTQLFNRIKIEAVFNDEIQRAGRYHTLFSIIMLDIDHFKHVNDTYGHDIGDKTLVDVAKILKQNSRTTDVVGRWGGEEFMIILPQTNANEAYEHAQKLREKIEQHNFEVVGRKTSSFGVSSFIDGDTSKTIVKRADDALYEAKKSGRNRVCLKEVH